MHISEIRPKEPEPENKVLAKSIMYGNDMGQA